MAETYSLRVAASCTQPVNGAGVLTCELRYVFTPGGGLPEDERPSSLFLLDAAGNDLRELGAGRNTTVEIDNLLNAYYEVQWREPDTGRVLASSGGPIACGPVPISPLRLDSASATNETATGDDGTATIQASGGTEPLLATLVELGLSRPATSGQPTTFSNLTSSTYRLRVTDSSEPVQQVEATVTIGPYVAPVAGCQDEYATDYDPAATSAGACSYAPLWRSAWGPTGMAVAVPALPGQVKAYTEALLSIGFRAGHPLAGVRPLAEAVRLCATVGPQGFAVFRLGPYVQRSLGAADEAGGYRLDINAQTVDDFYVGYELRRPTGELLAHGYTLNAAVPDAQLAEGVVLTAFEQVPTWPGFDWKRAKLASRNAGQYGAIDEVSPSQVRLPCPTNPLPVAWLNPQGGFDFWVFQGRPQLGDDVGESQAYTEASTGERRWSQRGEARGTITASSGVFNGPQFAAGLRTLWASPQVWYQPVPGGEWVPVTLGGGQFPVRRMGLARTEVSITFTEARPHYAQGA